MRKRKIVQLDEQTKITVQELTTGQIIDLQATAAKLGGGVQVKDLLQEYLPLVVPGLTFDKLRELAPSEIKDVVNAIKEVNDDFLQMLDWLGIKKKMLDAIKQDFASVQAEAKSA